MKEITIVISDVCLLARLRKVAAIKGISVSALIASFFDAEVSTPLSL